MRIGFLTCRDLPELTPDDRLAIAPLESRGHFVVPALWDVEEQWQGLDALVVRSMWDYHLRRAEFECWLAALESWGKPVVNPVPVLRWNADKRYLRELDRAGIAIVPTEFVERGSPVRLGEILERRGWKQAVVKPSFSATAHETWLTHEEPEAEARFQALLTSHTLLVQEYQPQIRTEGEWSLQFFNGRYSHTVRKRAAPGDFRVQDDFGGTIHSDPPPPGFVAQAERVVDALPPGHSYVRVDGVARGSRLLVMEVELIEPLLYLGSHPEAPERMARAVAAAIERLG